MISWIYFKKAPPLKIAVVRQEIQLKRSSLVLHLKLKVLSQPEITRSKVLVTSLAFST